MTNYTLPDSGGSADQEALKLPKYSQIQGGPGDDTIRIGSGTAIPMGGNNTVIGYNDALLNMGESLPWTQLAYYYSPRGIKADLLSGIIQNGFGGTDTVSGINWLTGSGFDDTILTGNQLNMTYVGSGGNDYYKGSDGFTRVVYFGQKSTEAKVTYDKATNTFTVIKNFSNGMIGTDTLVGISQIDFQYDQSDGKSFTPSDFDPTYEKIITLNSYGQSYFNNNYYITNLFESLGSEIKSSYKQTVIGSSKGLTSNVKFSWDYGQDTSPIGSFVWTAIQYNPYGPFKSINEIHDLKVEYSISLFGTSDKHNSSIHFNIYDQNWRWVNEIAINIHHPWERFVQENKRVLNYIDNDFSGKVFVFNLPYGGNYAANGSNIVLIPDKDVLSGVFDIKKFLNFLIDNGLVDGENKVASIDLGCEGQGIANVDVNKFVVTQTENKFPVFDIPSQTFSLAEDGSKSFSSSATDADADALTYSVLSQPMNGTATITGSTITYTAKANFNGADSFLLKVSDGKGGTDTQPISLSVTPVNDAPAFSSAVQSVSVVAGVAQNISLAANDVDGDVVTYAVATPSKGVATISGNILTYIPGTAVAGTDPITVTASDGKGGTATQTITATITAAPSDFRITAADGWVGTVGGNGLVYGTAAYQDVTVLSGVVNFDASFNKGGDVIRFSNGASSYTIARAGSSAIFAFENSLSANIPVGTVGALTSFSDGVRKLVYANSNFTLGAQAFSTSAATISGAADGTSVPTGASTSASARISLAGNDLRSGQISHITIGGKAIIYGNAAKSDVVAVASGVNVDLTFDASFNRGGDTIILDKSAGTYSAIRSGASIILTSTSQTLTIPVGTTNTTIKFADDSRVLVYSTSEGAIKLGTQTIATTATAISSSSVTTSLDVGTSSSTTTVSGANGKVIFTDDATKSSYVKITNFGSDDIIRVTGATEDKYSFTNADLDGDGQADDLSITFSNPDAGIVNDIQIINAVSSTAFIADKASAISAVGFNFISFG